MAKRAREPRSTRASGRNFEKREDLTLFSKDKKRGLGPKKGKPVCKIDGGDKFCKTGRSEGPKSRFAREEGFRDKVQRDRTAAKAKPHHQEVSEAASLDYIYGINAVKEAFDGERTINSIMIETGKHSQSVHDIIVRAKERRIVIKEVAKEKLRSLVGTDRHQGVIAYMSPIQYYDVEKIKLDTENADVVIALDEITDVNNLGAILRTVEACGLRYVMIPERRSCQLNSSVSKTSVGAIEYVRTVRVSSLSKALLELKDAGYWIIGTDGAATQDYKDVDYSGKIVIVIGSEGRGMRQNIRALCDFIVSIPMYGRINSLNASVSASLLLYEAIRGKK